MAAENATAPEVEEAAQENTEAGGASKLDSAARIVTRYSAASAAAGLIPMPLLDMTAIAALQVKMVHALARVYGVPFKNEWAKSVLASLTGTVASQGIGRIGLGSALKLVPGIGHLASVFALPGVACVATSSIGQIFTQHFESGGNLLNLNLKVWRPIYETKVQTEAGKN